MTICYKTYLRHRSSETNALIMMIFVSEFIENLGIFNLDYNFGFRSTAKSINASSIIAKPITANSIIEKSNY